MKPQLIARCAVKPLLISLFSPLLLVACVGLYFSDAGTPASPPPRHSLEHWPYHEYWTGIVFNGAKIGFSHNAIHPLEGHANQYELRSEAAFRLRFLSLSKKIDVRTRDRIKNDLTLDSFAYSYNLDGHEMHILGSVEDGALEVAVTTGGHTSRQRLELEEPLYPMSVLHLYPVFHGLEVSRRYSYLVYDGETQRVTTAVQEVRAYENSKLFSGKAFRVITKVRGHKTTTWLDAKGKPLLEIAMRGVLISALESEARAKRYLTLASLNKHDALIDYSLIRTETPLNRPREVTGLTVSLEGIPDRFVMAAAEGQNCSKVDDTLVCNIQAVDPWEEAYVIYASDVSPQFLGPSTTVQSDDPRVRTLAKQVTADTDTALEKIERLLAWIQANVKRKPVDVFSAVDVLDGRKAECQGHALLYAALARAIDIPTRVVNGLAYAEGLQGFLYHSWAESFVGGRWLPVDPTFGQIRVDATHIKLLDGETAADLLPLADIVGRVQARILDYE